MVFQPTFAYSQSFNGLLSKRFAFIVYKIGQATKFGISWFDYDNPSSGEPVSVFDTEMFQEHVSYTGVFYYDKAPRLEKYDYQFPTSWFYTDFTNELDNEVKCFYDVLKKEKLEKERKIVNEQQKLAEMKKQITSKLSEEELHYVKFCNLQEVTKSKKENSSNKLG